MGWNTFCYVTNAIVSPPAPEAEKFQGFTFKEIHQDGGRQNIEAPDKMLSLKVAYFLSDCTGAFDGNFSVITGSNNLNLYPQPTPQDASKEANARVDFIPPHELDGEAAKRLRPLKVKRGDAVIFSQRLWHTRSKNLSDKIRKVLFYGYTYRWIRGFEYYDINRLRMTYGSSLDPILEQMLDINKTRNTILGNLSILLYRYKILFLLLKT